MVLNFKKKDLELKKEEGRKKESKESHLKLKESLLSSKNFDIRSFYIQIFRFFKGSALFIFIFH